MHTSLRLLKKRNFINRHIFVVVFILICHNLFAQKSNYRIYTVNYPLFYMTQSISGDLATVEFYVPQNVDPAYWKPTSEELNKIQASDLIILNGANYAKWVDKYSLPRMKLVNTMRNSKEAFVYDGESITHSHGIDGQHSHESLAFTTWLDLKLAQEQAKEIYEVLLKKFPDHSSTLQKNYDDLLSRLSKLDQKITKITVNAQQKNVLASHPVYSYFAKRYNLDIHSVHWEPNSYPSSAEWTKIKSLKQKTGATTMLWEATPLRDTSSRLQSMGIQVIVFDPCANRPLSGDFVSVMNENIENLSQLK